LVAIVARYLRHQESVDVRLSRPPAIDDPEWTHVATGPNGELYDLRQLGHAIAHVVDAARRTLTARTSVFAGDPEMARLRLFCRLRGIDEGASFPRDDGSKRSACAWSQSGRTQYAFPDSQESTRSAQTVLLF